VARPCAAGLTRADADAVAALKGKRGDKINSKGVSYEVQCQAVVCQLFAQDQSQQQRTAGNGGVAGDGDEGDPEGGVLVLQNVTLGAGQGEIDCMVVRVNRPAEAFVDTSPHEVGRCRLTV